MAIIGPRVHGFIADWSILIREIGKSYLHVLGMNSYVRDYHVYMGTWSPLPGPAFY